MLRQRRRSLCYRTVRRRRLASSPQPASWPEPHVTLQCAGESGDSSGSLLLATTASVVIAINDEARLGRPFISFTYILYEHDQYNNISPLTSATRHLIYVNLFCLSNPTIYCYCESESISIKV